MALVVALDASATRDGRRLAGIGRYASELIRGLQALDVGVEIRPAAPRRPPRSDRWWYRYGWAQPGITATVLRERPQLLHGLGSDASLAFPLGRQVVTVHDVVPWTKVTPAASATHAYLALQRRLLHRVGAVIVPGEPIAADVVETLGVEPERISVVPHGISPVFSELAGGDDATTRARLGLPARYLLWVGSLHGPDPRKGLDVLIAALALLDPAQRPPLALVGRTGAGSDWVGELAAASGVSTSFTGFVTDSELAAAYRGAAAAVVPSRHEGFGLTALEALACGAPLLVTDAGSLPSVVGHAATIVPSGHPEAMAEGLRSLLSEQAVADRLRSAGPARAAEFSWSRTAQRTVAVYRRTLAAADPRSG